jgi:hypothetical protein
VQSSLLLLALWMPIALGVPHIANDLRYLVRPLPSLQRGVALAACGALIVLRLAGIVAGTVLLRAEAVVVAAWLLAMVCLAPTTRPRLLAVSLAAALVVAAPVTFALVAALAHNVVAIAAWLVVAKPGARRAAARIGAIAAAAVTLIAIGPRIQPLAAALHIPAPLALAFLMMQAVHYLIWLVWIPRERPARAVVLAALVVIGAGFVDAHWARTTYLALATFHIYLEIVVLAARAARRPA